MLCSIADVSRKSYYHHLKGGSCSDDVLIREMASLQEERHGSLGYRKMARIIRNSSGKAVNEKKIRRIMKENSIQSAVRRRKYSEEVYAKRRQLKADVPPDLIRRGSLRLSRERRWQRT